jgi:hypothetical protein
VSIHLNDVWSLTGDAALLLPLRNTMTFSLGTGVLATF